MKCERDNPDGSRCVGEIVDGYCSECGMAPAAAKAGPGAEPRGHTEQGKPTHEGESESSPTVISRGTTSRTQSSRTGSSGDGSGLVQLPSVLYEDPTGAVLRDPKVPESKRFCSRCEEPVGRGRDGAPGRETGFCRNCGLPFSFEPKLSKGDIVGGQYEVAGCLAHGGMGWVYLARDKKTSKWVALKGLLNTSDRDAMAAAVAEREFLAEIDHPNIVKIMNFDEDGGYIVMEYVGGHSLKQILLTRREANGGVPDPLPPALASEYILKILPALGHLHAQRLVFCDFKPDNVIQTQHGPTLIDLGGVYRLDRPGSAIFGTGGYQAPEIAAAGPSVASDLYTVARTLAVLCIDFKGYNSTYNYTLPDPESVPLFKRCDALYRFLLRGTATDPDKRFQSVQEMAEQLRGVQREIVAQDEGRPLPAPSARFTAPQRAGLERPTWAILPRPQASTDDAAAGYLAAVTATDPEQMIRQLRAAPAMTVEVELRLVGALIDAGEFDDALALLGEIEARDPWEWRVHWFRGLHRLAAGDYMSARRSFAAVYEELPGELAPKLALGLACECLGALEEGAGWYEIVARTDPSTTSASFGLARCRIALGDRAGAIEAYGRVPDTSIGHTDAQIALVRCLTAADDGLEPRIDDLFSAAAILQRLDIDPSQRERLSVEVLGAALGLTLNGSAANGHGLLLGHELSERGLRLGLERSYRALARVVEDRSERIRLVDLANRTRPRTWT
jgi:serine/threonine-protein kinase PknG